MKGLTTKEAEALLEQFGHNALVPAKKPGFLAVFFSQFNNFLSILLLIAAVLAIGIGEAIDGSLILAIVFLNALFGVYQEKKAEAAIEALSKMSVTKVRVVRDGEEHEIDSRDIVPGDIMYLEEGSRVAADAKLIHAVQLEMNESALTGESLPVSKKNGDEIYMGTVVTRGRTHAEVTSTGARTKFGEIAKNLSTIKEPKTPLQKKLESLTKAIGIIGIAASVLVFFLSRGDGTNLFEAFLLAVSLAVAVVPEGLPAVLTLTLAIGVKEMAKRNAIVRKLSAVETFGSVTLICTDKTGTLTTNKMRVKELFVNNQMKSVEIGQSQLDSTTKELLHCSILCSTASLVPVQASSKNSENSFDVLGDPTEGAPLILAEKLDMHVETIRSQWETIDEMPFDSVTKRMWVAVKSVEIGQSRLKSEAVTIYAKGAPESILSISNQIMIHDKVESLTDVRKKEIEITLEEWGRKGLRVLAFAYKNDGILSSRAMSDEVEGSLQSRGHSRDSSTSPGVGSARNDRIHNLIFLGMVAIHDAPRPEVNEAIRKAHQAGISVVMITGDNEITAEAIGSYVGLLKEGDEILNGSQVENFTDEELLEKLPKVRIFARTTPFHKQRIVSLYQKLGEVVAVTGDGVNDSIALKQADVGLAMGLIGTDVAREAADIVIADDNFATIVNAIEEGRNIIKNVKNSIIYLLSCNIAEAMSLIGGLILGLPPLFLPIQLLYINLVTDGVPALALAYSPHEEHLMRQGPKKSMTLLEKPEFIRIFLQGFFATVFVFAAYFFYQYLERWHSVGATAAFTVLALIQSFIFMDTWLEHRWFFKNTHRMNSKIFWLAFIIPFIAQAAILYIPSAELLFKVEQLSILDFVLLTVFSSLIMVLLSFVRLKHSHLSSKD